MCQFHPVLLADGQCSLSIRVVLAAAHQLMWLLATLPINYVCTLAVVERPHCVPQNLISLCIVVGRLGAVRSDWNCKVQERFQPEHS